MCPAQQPRRLDQHEAHPSPAVGLTEAQFCGNLSRKVPVEVKHMRRFVIGLVITGICGGLLLRLIDWASTGDALRDANVEFIVLAVTCLVLSLAAKTVRWRLLLPSSAPVTTPRLYRILHISFL